MSSSLYFLIGSLIHTACCVLWLVRNNHDSLPYSQSSIDQLELASEIKRMYRATLTSILTYWQINYKYFKQQYSPWFPCPNSVVPWMTLWIQVPWRFHFRTPGICFPIHFDLLELSTLFTSYWRQDCPIKNVEERFLDDLSVNINVLFIHQTKMFI